MSWDYRITEQAIKQLRKLGPQASRRVIDFLDERIQNGKDPRQFGKALRGDLGEFWRYRVGEYRILCSIDVSYWLACRVLFSVVCLIDQLFSLDPERIRECLLTDRELETTVRTTTHLNKKTL